mgnify:CR=1 FL=1
MKPYPALLAELLSKELYSLRQQKSLTQEAMAEQLRISSRAYSDLERGKYAACADSAVCETGSSIGGDRCCMNDITDIAEVYDLLYRLGFSATNTAFFQLSYAVYHNFGTPLIGSVFLSNHILPRFEFLGKWRMPLPFLFCQ